MSLHIDTSSDPEMKAFAEERKNERRIMMKEIRLKQGCGHGHKCGNPPTPRRHECSYLSDVKNDSSKVCRCCDRCQKECSNDI